MPDDGERLRRLNELLALIVERNPFQRARLEGLVPLSTLDELARLPFTTKDDLVSDQAANPPFGTNLTWPHERYTPAPDERNERDDAARARHAGGLGVVAAQPRRRVPGRRRRSRERVALAYSFGPYIQLWASYEGAQDVGALVIAMGGMDSLQRLRTMRDYGATTLLCTPTYAARCHDHAGLTEVGSLAYPCDSCGGMHLREDEFVAEILDPETGAPVADVASRELVVTALGRTGFPVIRYRTGDVVERSPVDCGVAHPGRWLPQGILGRSDDMVVIRGMNVFPSAIEQILREFEGVGEFRITVYSEPTAMDEVLARQFA